MAVRPAGDQVTGGRAGARRFIERYGAVLEGDFQRYYGIDLAEAVSPGEGQLTTRRLLALIYGLPAESATVRELTDGQAGWTSTDELLLHLVNLVQLWRHEWTLAHVSETDAASIPEPVLLTRPWEPDGQPGPVAVAAPPEPDHFATHDEMAAFFGGSIRYTPD